MVVQPRCCARVGRRQVYGPRSPQGGRGPLIFRGRYRSQPIEARDQLILSRTRASPRVGMLEVGCAPPGYSRGPLRCSCLRPGVASSQLERPIVSRLGGRALARRCQARLASPRAPAPKRGGAWGCWSIRYLRVMAASAIRSARVLSGPLATAGLFKSGPRVPRG